jgi:hypothetical protein
MRKFDGFLVAALAGFAVAMAAFYAAAWNSDNTYGTKLGYTGALTIIPIVAFVLTWVAIAGAVEDRATAEARKAKDLRMARLDAERWSLDQDRHNEWRRNLERSLEPSRVVKSDEQEQGEGERL